MRGRRMAVVDLEEWKCSSPPLPPPICEIRRPKFKLSLQQYTIVQAVNETRRLHSLQRFTKTFPDPTSSPPSSPSPSPFSSFSFSSSRTHFYFCLFYLMNMSFSLLLFLSERRIYWIQLKSISSKVLRCSISIRSMLRASGRGDSGHFLWEKWGETPSNLGKMISVFSDHASL